MSRIYFTDQTGEVAVRGTERAYAGIMVTDLGTSLMMTSGASALQRFIRPYHRLKNAPDVGFAESLRLELGFGFSGPIFELDGQPLNDFEVVLNTVMVGGSDPVRLLARIHGQCEIHARVDGMHREWFAGLIEQGLETNVFRGDSGWEGVVDFARQRSDQPIVMHYSVTDSFPNPVSSTWQPEESDVDDYDYEPWYDLPAEEKWRLGLEWLTEHGPVLEPGNFARYRFGHQVSGFDLAARSNAEARAASNA
ncbi:hypothetical protein CH255_20355 [Rhodococcus sp. 05-2255-2A2]|uniref:hypothetical protein n=1 Tax=unclassified Rhodococcus (in: high G+C Gram-positive bacteria) TaxID=192944 RepID=UPI000B9B31F5|nr:MULTISPECIES: hypothetical protein [unclassified Rhodococcus (in: high G+C Gram-positive bacteria)]OZE08556.1 hypothetical protein CH250_17290 [Rhodococcus sp. 05-2255-3C]OZE16818.1 hypothetical protein CH255_20355 [Rhodococcus sp. 05-2255-2A2]